MKIKRQKKLSKTLQFYINNFSFRRPYQVLVDGTFCHIALQNQINIADNMPRYLQSELKLLTTQCVIVETENLGRKVSGALKILKQYGIHKCGHEGKPVGAVACLLSMLGKRNEKHYMVATQDRDLQEKVRNVPGVPLLYLHLKTPTLEAPSEASELTVRRKFAGIIDSEMVTVQELKERHGLVASDEPPVKKKRKKGPNPLSCKKKKKHTGVQNKVISKKGEGADVGKKKRKKIRIPKHIREELLKNVSDK